MSASPAAIRQSHLVGIFLLSLATLLLELALTRVLSVALWYHFGFLIISTALLGFGAAGVTLSLWRKLREEVPLNWALTLLSLAFGLITLLSFWLMQQVPFDPFSLLSDRKQLLYMPLYYLAIAAPFYCSGLAIGLLLTRGGEAVNRLYALDLFGAGVGCAAIALMMPLFGGSGSVVAAAAVGLFSATVFGWNKFRTWAVAGLMLGPATGVGAFYGEKMLPIALTANKGGMLKQLTPVYSAWNTFSKVDVFDLPPDTVKNLPFERVFIIDGGTAATGIVDLSKGIEVVLAEIRSDSTKRQMSSTRTEVAALGKKNPHVLIIGSGAGDEILESQMIGAASVTGVELNPIIADVQTNRLKAHWGGLHQRPGVKLVVDEGRSFVRRSDKKYDVIVSSHTISNAAVASGALSLAENYVLTKEAFQDYWDHLTADGVLFFTRPESQIARLFSTATELLREQGIKTPGAHLYAYTESTPRFRKLQRRSFMAGFLLKKSPLSPTEVNGVESLLRINNPDTAADASFNQRLYSPYQATTSSLYAQIVNSPDLNDLYQQHAALLAPATDDRPFFNQHARWSSIGWKNFRDIFTQDKLGRMALEDQPVAEITLIMILLQSVVIAAVLILVPLLRFSRQGLRVPGRWRFLTYFAGLGAGFIMIEIAFLQRFSLFLGQPIYTYAVVLASLLVFTGLGSLLSERFAPNPQPALRRIIPLMLAVLLLTALLMPTIFRLALGWILPVRILVALLLVAPVGVLLGIPFATGLRLIAQTAPALTPWAWGVNGFFTVIGSVSALMLGMAFGFKMVLGLAGLCYLTSLFAIATRKGTTRKSEEEKKVISG
jgi:predicted membrane-bound spermidine synthase